MTLPDIYSFGIVLYQMATGGNFPFLPRFPRNDSPEEQSRFWWDIYKLHCHAPVPRLNSPLFPIIQKCLEKEPTKRYQSFAELRSEFAPILKKLTGEVIKVPEQGIMEAEEWINKGMSLNNLGKHQEAIVCFDRAIEIDPRDALAWFNKGSALSKLGRHEEAIACYDRAIEIDPRDALAWINKGVALADLGRHQEAIVCYDRVLEINPRFALAWFNKGNVLNKLRRPQEAIVCYDRALEINPIYAEAWFNKGVVLSGLGRHQEAIVCYDRAIEINPRFAEAWFNKGSVLSGLGNHQEAIVCYDRAIEIDPRDAETWYNKGVALSTLGKYQAAIEAFENFIKFALPHYYADRVAKAKALIQELKAKAEKKGLYRHDISDYGFYQEPDISAQQEQRANAPTPPLPPPPANSQKYSGETKDSGTKIILKIIWGMLLLFIIGYYIGTLSETKESNTQNTSKHSGKIVSIDEFMGNKPYGEISIYTDIPYGNIAIYIDGKYIGNTAHYFHKGAYPACGQEGTVSMILSAGPHYLSAYHSNGTTSWETTVNIQEKCQLQLLTNR